MYEHKGGSVGVPVGTMGTDDAGTISQRAQHTEFYKERGISKNTYFYWQRKIRETACEQLALSGQRFTEVVAAQPPTCQISIAVGSVQITVDGSYPTDKLAALIRELARL